MGKNQFGPAVLWEPGCPGNRVQVVHQSVQCGHVEGQVLRRGRSVHALQKKHVQMSKTVAKVQKIIMKMAFSSEPFELFKFHEDLLHEKQKTSIVKLFRLFDFFQISLKTWRHFAKKTFIFVHFFPFSIINSRGKNWNFRESVPSMDSRLGTFAYWKTHVDNRTIVRSYLCTEILLKMFFFYWNEILWLGVFITGFWQTFEIMVDF